VVPGLITLSILVGATEEGAWGAMFLLVRSRCCWCGCSLGVQPSEFMKTLSVMPGQEAHLHLSQDDPMAVSDRVPGIVYGVPQEPSEVLEHEVSRLKVNLLGESAREITTAKLLQV